jgi:hypothetical protein
MLDLAQGSSSTSTAGNYLGTVASSNHLLLPSATQQLAGFTEPNNSFVAVKEMGSGRYRVYKIDRDGIHAPKFSESGTFTPSDQVISGAMQFSRDGKYLASVYSYLEGGTPKSTVEVFSFDKTNGNLSLYASFDLSGRGYGIEVSEDEKRLFISMENSIREFFIEAQPLSIGVPIPGTNFNTCFAANSSVLGRSLCIKNSSSQIRSGDFRALQRGPVPADFIFAAVENRNFVAQIDERTRLTSRSRVISPFIQMSLSGKVLKGLPRYNVPIPKSSGLDSPALIGDSEMCLKDIPIPARPPVTGSVVYELSIAGEDLDVHTFRFEREFEGKVTKENVTTFQDPSNPTEWKITFTKPGLYTIYVTVQRCDFTFDELSKKVDIYTPPFILPATINFCDVPVPASPLEIKALNDAFYTMADFEIEWRRADPITLIPFGPVISTDNKLVLTNPAGIGQYVVTAKHKFRTDPCPSSTSVFIGPPRGLDLGIVNPTLCFDETLIAFPYLPPSPPSVSSGEKGTFRIYRKIGIRVPVFELSNSDRLTLPVKNKLAAGDYELEFEVLDTLALSSSGPNAPKCLLFLTEDFTILPEPKIDFVVTNSTSCASPTGEILLRNVDPLFNITINGLPLGSLSPTPIANLAAREVKITGLSVGSYLVVVENSGCDFSTNILVRDASQKVKIPEFSFEVESARCNTPLTKGQLTINFPTGFSGNYQIVNPFSTPVTVISRNVLPISKKAVELLDAGNYKLDFLDAENCFLTSFTFEVIDEIGTPTSITQYFCPISNPNPELNFPSYLNLSDPSIIGIAWRDSTGLLLLTPPAGTPFKAPSKGKYSLEVSYGTCTMTFNFDLLERCSIQYTLPNTIQLSNAPKGRSGTNFQDNVLTLVTSNFVKNVQALVYNRWGQLIHVKEYNSQTAEASFNEVIWDGKVEGQFVPIGTYVVVLFLTDLNDVVEKTTNSVLVLR